MSRLLRTLLGVVLACLVSASAASARDIYVATNGSDGWAGSSGAPYRNIKTAVSRAVSGDAIHVRAGTYNESWILVKGGLTLVSEDGLYAAKINGATTSVLRFEGGASNCEVRGFEIYGTWGQGSPGDGLVRVYNASNIRIKDMLLHDAANDCDVIKIGGTGYTTSNILVDNCICYNPGPRPQGTWQECVDVFPADHVTLRYCWLYHTPQRCGDYITYAKGGSHDILWESNIFGPAYSDPDGNASTSAGGPGTSPIPNCVNFIARNNLFLQCSGDGAFALLSTRNGEFYNNIIWGYKGNRAAIEFWTAQVGAAPSENFRFYNNTVVSQATPVFSNRGYLPVPFEHDYNIYYQTAGGGDVNINTEPHSRFVSPMLTSPSAPVLGTDTWASIVARFRPKFNSPAIDAALDLGSLVPTDIYGLARPVGPAYDIGAYEVLPGDANADGHVDVVDLLTLVAAFGCVSGDANYDPACDFNADGSVDVVDLLYLVDTFGLY
jgi:hypothetical protein